MALEILAHARIYHIRIVADRPDPVTIEGTIGRDGYLVYLVISGHKNDHKPTRFIPVKVMRARTSSLARSGEHERVLYSLVIAMKP